MFSDRHATTNHIVTATTTSVPTSVPTSNNGVCIKRVRCTTARSCFHCTHKLLNDSINKRYLYRFWQGIAHTNAVLQWTVTFQGFLSD